MTPEQSLSLVVILLAAATVAAAMYAAIAIRRSNGDGASGDDEDGNEERERRGSSGRETLAGVGAATFDEDGEAVTCAECGAENDPSYRYCRGCASELPGVWVGGQDVSDRGGRSIE